MPKTELDGLPVIEADESEKITVAVKPEDLEEGDEANSRTTSDCNCTTKATRH